MSNERTKELLEAYVGLVVERKVREADVSDGTKVPHGSSKHVKDLKARIAQLSHFRDKQRRGSEARANYSRLIAKLKGELSSAQRASGKKLSEVDEPKPAKWWEDPELRNIDSPRYDPDIWQKMALEPEYKRYIDLIKDAADPKELARAKKAILKAIDGGETDMKDGMWLSFYERRKKELKDMGSESRGLADQAKASADARMDRMLRTRDSSGKATPRRFR